MRYATDFMGRYFCGLPVTGVEVGVCYGGHAQELLDNIPKLHLHLVDNGSADTLAPELMGSQIQPNSDIEWHKMDSLEAVKKFEDNSLDFVYIDSEHDYNTVREDLNAWFPKVKIDGVICGHDYSGNEPGVRKAVNEFLGDFELYHREGCYDWWFIKSEEK